MQDGITGYNLIFLRTKNQADGQIVTFTTLEVVKHAQVQIHLPHVLMFQPANFEVDQDEAFEQEVVKDQIDEKVLRFGRPHVDATLP